MKRAHPFTPSEHKIQSELMEFLDVWLRPDHWCFAIPNQSNRHINNAVKMKAEGVRAGVYDICFMRPAARVFWLEMKKPKGRLSEDQKDFRDVCDRLEHPHAVAYSFDEAVSILRERGMLRATRQPAHTMENRL